MDTLLSIEIVNAVRGEDHFADQVRAVEGILDKKSRPAIDLHQLAEEVAGSLASAGLLFGLKPGALKSITLCVERCLRGALPAGEAEEPFLERAAGGGR